MNYTTRTTCRVCGSSDLTPLFSLGNQFVNDFLEDIRGHRCKECNGTGEVPYGNDGWGLITFTCSECDDGWIKPIQCPIELVLCRGCTLVQQKHTAPQELMYSRHYWYRSGVTQTMRAALADVVESIKGLVTLDKGDVVLDIGSNDGTLLRNWSDKLTRVGVEPADNLATEGNYQGLTLIHDFWPVEEWTFAKAKVVTCCGMFYDLESPNLFIADIAKVLHPDGVFVAQLQCLKQTVELADVGNLCHEHLEFYSLTSLEKLLGDHGLEIFDIEENKVNGGSYRLFIQHNTCSLRLDNIEATKRVMAAYSNEEYMKLGDPASYTTLYQQMGRNRDKVVSFIRKEAASGNLMWAYGASTKGNTLLQWFDMSRESGGFAAPVRWSSLIEAACDRLEEKHGKVTVGTGIPIKSNAEFRTANPDYALVLPYTFLSEFIELEREWLTGGGKFIVPLPVPHLVSLNKVGQVMEETL